MAQQRYPRRVFPVNGGHYGIEFHENHVMMEAMRTIISAMAQPLRNIATAVVCRRPVGIWVAWIGLLYALLFFSGDLVHLLHFQGLSVRTIELFAGVWILMCFACAALFRRRLVSRMLVGMTMSLLFFSGDHFEMALSVMVILCLLANRRWFDERIPPTR